jgi:hypothetical protein
MTDKSQYNFRELAINIVKDQLKEHCKDYYALGINKIFMMLEVVALLDKAMWKAVSIILLLIYHGKCLIKTNC